jgi:hypothetical protein
VAGERTAREPEGLKIRISSSMTRPKRFWWLILGLTVLHIVPVWWFQYLPSQDGPSHVENSYMLLHYFDEDAAYSRYYDLNLKPFPNWFSHSSMTLLMTFLPPLTAEKALLTLYVIFFVFAMVYFLASAGDDKVFFVLLCFPFIYNYLMQMGFYNFAFSLPLTFLILGYWWRRRDARMGWRMMSGLNALLILAYFCNLLSQVMAVAGVLFLAAFYHRRRLLRVLRLAVLLVPSCLLPVYYVGMQPARAYRSPPATDLLKYFVRLGSLNSHSQSQAYLGVSLACLLGILLVYTALRSVRPSQDTAEPPAGPVGGFLGLGALFTFVFFLGPARMFGGGFLDDRLSLFPVLAILPWLKAGFRRPLKYGIGIAAVGLTVLHLGVNTYHWGILNNGLEEYTSGTGFVGRNETILPISFDHRGGESARIGVYRHAASHYCIAVGAVNLANYEGDKAYFPLRYKALMNPFATIGPIESGFGNVTPEAYPEKPDYVLLWSSPAQFRALPWISRNYTPIHALGRLKLYKSTDYRGGPE